MNLAVGLFWDVGSFGDGWSRVSMSITGVYYLHMDFANVYPSNSYDCWLGFPLQCYITF